MCKAFCQLVPTGVEQLGKANSLLGISLQTSVEMPYSSPVLSEQEESEFQQNFYLLTAEDVVSHLAAAASQASSRSKSTVVSVAGWHMRKNKNGSRLFYFTGWEPWRRYSISVWFFGWTSILKTYLRVFKTNRWNFLAIRLSFSIFYNSALFCSFLELFSMCWEDESSDLV